MKRMALTILDVIRDPNLFGPLFTGASWAAWRAFLAYLFGLPMNEEQAALARRCTGRQGLPVTQFLEAVVIAGRRAGKSFVMALIGVYVACFRTFVFPPGGWAVVVLLASDRRQTRVLKRYVSGLLHAIPMLAEMIVNETADAIELSNGVVIEIHTASFRAVRGYTIVAAICDEIAFWPTDDSANPDTEILNALRPAMATIPNALLLMISTPYARRGELWKVYKAHYGQEGDPILVWQADTRTMNPTVPQVVIDHAYADDPASAAAEYGVNFEKTSKCLFPEKWSRPASSPIALNSRLLRRSCIKRLPIPRAAAAAIASPWVLPIARESVSCWIVCEKSVPHFHRNRSSDSEARDGRSPVHSSQPRPCVQQRLLN